MDAAPASIGWRSVYTWLPGSFAAMASAAADVVLLTERSCFVVEVPLPVWMVASSVGTWIVCRGNAAW